MPSVQDRFFLLAAAAAAGVLQQLPTSTKAIYVLDFCFQAAAAAATGFAGVRRMRGGYSAGRDLLLHPSIREFLSIIDWRCFDRCVCLSCSRFAAASVAGSVFLATHDGGGGRAVCWLQTMSLDILRNFGWFRNAVSNLVGGIFCRRCFTELLLKVDYDFLMIWLGMQFVVKYYVNVLNASDLISIGIDYCIVLFIY